MFEPLGVQSSATVCKGFNPVTMSIQISAEQTLLYLFLDRQLKDDHDARAISWIRGYNPWWKIDN